MADMSSNNKRAVDSPIAMRSDSQGVQPALLRPIESSTVPYGLQTPQEIAEAIHVLSLH